MSHNSAGGLTLLAAKCPPSCSLPPHQQDGGGNELEKCVDQDRLGKHLPVTVMDKTELRKIAN